ncbi:MAG: hypothetical protein ACJ8CR_31480, partial [Roseiflexaceae bacterium]
RTGETGGGDTWRVLLYHDECKLSGSAGWVLLNGAVVVLFSIIHYIERFAYLFISDYHGAVA